MVSFDLPVPSRVAPAAGLPHIRIRSRGTKARKSYLAVVDGHAGIGSSPEEAVLAASRLTVPGALDGPPAWMVRGESRGELVVIQGGVA